MSGTVAGLAPTALTGWLALSLVFLGNVPRPGPGRLAVSLLAAAAALVVPVRGWMVIQWIAVFEPAPSVTAIALLVAALVARAGGPKLLRPCDWNCAWAFGAAGAALLFPSTFGLSSVDIYSWGWSKAPAIAVGFLAAGLLLKGNRFGVVLFLALLVFLLFPGNSNAWDVLIDPVYAGAAVCVCLFRVTSHFLPRKPGAGRPCHSGGARTL